MAIYFHSEDVDFPSLNVETVKIWVENAISLEDSIPGEINFIFCSDDYLLEINKQFLNHDYFTDVITFDYSENDIISGDIFISIERIRDNAKELDVDYHVELHRIIIHGVLHLLGYLDKEPSDKFIMTLKEDFYLKKL